LFIFESFWHILGDDIFRLRLLPYHEALYQYYNLTAKSEPRFALHDIAAAVIHEVRLAVGITAPLETWKITDINELINLLDSDTLPRCAARMPELKRASLSHAMDEVKSSSDHPERLARSYSELYRLLDESLPYMFDIEKADMLTQHLCAPKEHRYERSIAWQPYDGPEVKALEELFLSRPEVRHRLGEARESFIWYGDDPYMEEREPPEGHYWYYLLAVFDGERWRPFRLVALFGYKMKLLSMINDTIPFEEETDEVESARCALWLESNIDGWPIKPGERKQIAKAIRREFASFMQSLPASGPPAG
jgi:hypothetical protein